MSYQIRLANEADLQALCTIRNNEQLFTNYLHLQQDDQAYLAVAQVEQELVGFGVLKLNGPYFPKLSDIYVKPAFRNQGIGQALIAFREQFASQLGYHDIFVSVDSIENPKMVQLVTKLHYFAICEPYEKIAIYYNEDGSPYQKAYVRTDFKKVIT